MWSPQHYRENGRQREISDALIERAAAAIEAFIDDHPNLPVLLTLGHLADRTGISWFHLRLLTEGSRSSGYTYFRIRKHSGGHRLISVPEPKLMIVQRWIAAHILSGLPVHRASFAFAPKSSIVGCAAQHRGARWLIKLDISGFFGSISEIQVYRVFRQAGYTPLVSLELARLCTHAPFMSRRYRDRPEWLVHSHRSWPMYQRPGLGFLPQGAPTSPMLSNLIMRETDKCIANLAAHAGLTYTRYSDDITFSTTGVFNRAKAMKVVLDTTAILRRIGLQINTKKTRIVPPGARKVVLGLLVDGPQPRLTREFRDRLRQHLHYLEKLGPEAHRATRGFDTVAGLYRHIRGLIDYAQSVDPTFAGVMRTKFNAVGWSLDTADAD
jgi:RNA-directed DNA polymerase